MVLIRWFWVAAVFGVFSSVSCDGCAGDHAWDDGEGLEPSADDYFREPYGYGDEEVEESREPAIDQRHAAVRASDFEKRYQAFLAANAARIDAAKRPPPRRDVHSNTRTVDVVRSLLRDLEDLVRDYPDHAAVLAPDLWNLRTVAIAEWEAEFVRLGFDVRKDYAVEFRARDRCIARAGSGSFDHCLVQVKDREVFSCELDDSELAQYLALLNVLPAPVAKVRTASLAYARVLEEPEIFFCEGEPHYEFARAYAIYEQLGRPADMRRVARSRAEELLRETCSEAESYFDEDVHQWATSTATCAHEQSDAARGWFDRAGGISGADWRKRMVRLSEEAEQLELPCAAIDYAGHARDTERFGQLTLAHGVQCGVYSTKP